MLFIDVACNDPSNGLFDYSAPQLSVGCAEFQHQNMIAPIFRERPGHIILSGKSWPIKGCTEWVGNWCWNRYTLYSQNQSNTQITIQFLTWLRGRELYSCTDGPSDFFDWFNGDNSVSNPLLESYVLNLNRSAFRVAD